MFSNEIVISIIKYLDTNIYEKISIDDLSNTLNYNKDYLMRLFKRELDITIFEYINKKRIYNSLNEYSSDKVSILKIALSYGFYSQEYYSEIFHKTIGVSPTTYHKYKHHNRYISYRSANKINDNLAFLEYKFRSINNYLLNTKPTRPVKILSIFK